MFQHDGASFAAQGGLTAFGGVCDLPAGDPATVDEYPEDLGSVTSAVCRSAVAPGGQGDNGSYASQPPPSTALMAFGVGVRWRSLIRNGGRGDLAAPCARHAESSRWTRSYRDGP